MEGSKDASGRGRSSTRRTGRKDVNQTTGGEDGLKKRHIQKQQRPNVGRMPEDGWEVLEIRGADGRSTHQWRLMKLIKKEPS